MPSKKNNTIKFIYFSIYVFISALFLKLLYDQIARSVFEQDLLWFIPTIAREMKGLSFPKLIIYFFSLFPTWYAVPSLKIYTFFILSFASPLAKYFIFVSIAIHFCCSLLLFSLTRKLGLGLRTGFLSALMYLTLFAHFHAYMWPMAFQHLIVVFFILLGLNLYLIINKLIESGGDYRAFFVLNLLVALGASFCSFSILILPVVMIGHILFCARNNEDRIRKYDIWAPLFLIYSLHPIATLAAGECRIFSVVRPLVPLIANSGLFSGLFNDSSISLKILYLFLLELALLFSFRAALMLYQKHNLKNTLKWALITTGFFATILLVGLGGVRRLLIPYNVIVPFAGILASFLEPLQTALLIDSTRPYYFIPLGLNVFSFLSSLFILGFFIKIFIFKNKGLVILMIFYMADMIYLYLWNPVASRYLIYLSPIFCIIFCAVFDQLYTYLTKSINVKTAVKETALIAVFLGMCIPNLLAIELALFRGRTANGFCTYDYLRTADTVRGDLGRKNSGKYIGEKPIYVNNVVPITFAGKKDFFAADPYDDNARFVFMQVFNGPSLNVKVNQIPKKGEDSIIYSVSRDGYEVNNRDGVNVNKFSQLFKKGLGQLTLNRYPEAEKSFREAVGIKPYLLNYILLNLRLEDFGWITNGDDLSTWLNKIGCFYSVGCGKGELDRTRYVLGIMNREIDEYIQCLFYMAFLKHVEWDPAESKQWFCKIKFLENDYKQLRSRLMRVSFVMGNAKLVSFLDSFNSASLYVAPENYIDRCAFEKFLRRLIQRPMRNRV
jgi:hypothetical protein